MQNGQSQISDLFNADRIFKIPSYQRTYTWKEENLKDFFDDLVNQRGEKPYFLGTFLFHKQDNRKDYEVIDIVDGQQRLTTVIIFMKILIERLLELESSEVTEKTYKRYVKDTEGVYKLELENADSSFLNQYIFENNDLATFETPSQKDLYFAKTYLKEELFRLPKYDLERIYKILKKSTIINYVVNDLSDATQIFELLNDRGRRLTNLEGIKSFLMYKISSLKLKDHEQPLNTIQNCISKIYRIIEGDGLNENDILRYHTIAFEDSKVEVYNSPDKFIKDKINHLFITDTEDIEIKETILDYINRLTESFLIYAKLRRNEMKSEHLDNFFMIGKVGPFYPFLMIVYKNQEDRLDEFCKLLSRFTFRASFIGLQNRNEKLYKSIRRKEDFFQLFDEIVKDNWWNIKNRTIETLEFENYYKWINKNIVKYILFKYENHLRKKPGFPSLTRKSYFDQDKRTKLNIEHISAQKSGLKFSNKFNESYLHSIGNLVIDSTAPNSSKGKKSIDKKLGALGGAPLMSQNEIKDQTKNWKKRKEVEEFIKERALHMQDFIKTHILELSDE
jgi:uncharacterized protein with ParB-like and HNH nuclease domain